MLIRIFRCLSRLSRKGLMGLTPAEHRRRRRAPPRPSAPGRVRGPKNPSKVAMLQSKLVSGCLTHPIDTAVTADGLPGCVGSGRAASHQPENSRLRTGPNLAETHPGGFFDGTRGPKRLSPGTTRRPGPTVVRMHQPGWREHEIRPLLQSKISICQFLVFKF